MQLTSQWDQRNGSFIRSFRIVDGGGTVIEEFDEIPTLNQLREAERSLGERINLQNVGIPCLECSTEIGGRFAANPSGLLLCWECATTTDSHEEGVLRVNTDPTKAVISESSLNQKSLCDYVINVATGCRHGCKFCYVPTTPAIDRRKEMLQEQANVDDAQLEWGSYLLYRDDLPERLNEKLSSVDKNQWKQTRRGRGVVMLSSGTDCYQDRRAAQITRACVHELVDNEIPVRILTRSPAVVRDIDLLRNAGDYVTVGSSIPSFDTDLVRAMEPNAPPPKARWKALDQLQNAGVRIFVSFSPTYPMTDGEFWNMLTHFKAINPEVVFHEPINPRGANFQMCLEAAVESGHTTVAKELDRLQKDRTHWVKYAVRQINTVQRLAEEIGGLTIHSWPDESLISQTSGPLRDQLKAMKESISPERFPHVEGEPCVDEAQTPFAESPDTLRGLIEP